MQSAEHKKTNCGSQLLGAYKMEWWLCLVAVQETIEALRVVQGQQ